MFQDRRSRKVVLVAHCLLNQNSISDGTADFPSQFKEVIEILINAEIGLLQLPCPELTCLGLDRHDREGGRRPLPEENTRIRRCLETDKNLKLLREKAQEIVFQVKEYESYGFKVVGCIGINRSPSCGVQTTTDESKEVDGPGVFMRVLSEALRSQDLNVEMIGVKTSQVEESVKKVRELVKRSV